MALDQLNVCDKLAAMLNDNFEVQWVLARRLESGCVPRYLPVDDSGKDIGEKEVVFVLQNFEEEFLDAFLTPIEGVPLFKLTSAKSVQGTQESGHAHTPMLFAGFFCDPGSRNTGRASIHP